MNKLILLCFFLSLYVIGDSQVSKTINVTTAGTLIYSLTPNEGTNITNLTVTGNLDARDIQYMRDQMYNLTVVDLSAANILAYEGSEGTVMYTSVIYPANEMPRNSPFTTAKSPASSYLPLLLRLEVRHFFIAIA